MKELDISSMTTKEKFELAFKLLDEAQFLLDQSYNELIKQEKNIQ